jgi:branched-subunit amino acid ABC-type transport system permease component
MQPKKVETLVWLLIYSGLLIAALGLFLQRQRAGRRLRASSPSGWSTSPPAWC